MRDLAKGKEVTALVRKDAAANGASVVAPAEEIGGQYCENCHVGQIVPENAVITAASGGVRGYALDPNNAEALWRKSEELVGESF